MIIQVVKNAFLVLKIGVKDIFILISCVKCIFQDTESIIRM